ncbi:MAG: C39 family peptidase [Lachnospiraceae bacterium]|nr:C39 family peptidase [Lachnospiraceae bacterium]
MQRRRRKKGMGTVKVFIITVLILSGLGGIAIGRNIFFTGDSEERETISGLGEIDEEQNREFLEQIQEKREQIPEELMEALEKNPEMAEFVAGYPQAEKKEAKKFSEAERNQTFPLLLQWDKRWGYADYGESIIALSGCGPTCLSMVVFGLTRREVTPYETARYSERAGYYVEGSGTSWGLMTEGAAHYGLSARELSLSEAAMKAVLNNGGMIICAMRPGDFTTEGHFIVIYGYGEKGFLVHDPNSPARSGRSWSMEKLSGQIKNLWGYSF